MMTVALAETMGNMSHVLAKCAVLPPTDLGSKERMCEAHGEYLATGIRHNIGKLTQEVWTKCPTCVEDMALEAEDRRIKAEQAEQKARVETLL